MQFSQPENTNTVPRDFGQVTGPESGPPLSRDEFDALLGLCVGLTFFEAGSSPACELKRLAELGLMELGRDGTLQPTQAGKELCVRRLAYVGIDDSNP